MLLRHCQFVESTLDEPLGSPFQHAHEGWILGGKDFIDRIRRLFHGADRRDPDLPLRRRLLALKVDDVLRTVASHFAVDQDIFGSRRGGRPRAVAAWLARRYTEASLRELCGHFGLSHPGSLSNLTRQIDRDCSDSAVFRDALAKLEHRLIEF